MRRALLLALALLATLGACGEKPPRVDAEAGHDYNAQPLPTPMRDRTLKQGGL